VESILLRLEQAYWDLQRAHRDLAVRIKSAEAAESLVRQVEARLEAQNAAEADRIQAESGLAQRRIAVLESRRTLELQDRVFKDLLLPDLSVATPLLDPTDEPVLDLTLPVYEEVLARAEQNRPEYERAELQIANAEDQLAVVRNNRLPQVDLEGSVGVNGLGGSFGSAFDDGRQADNNSWSLGVVYRTPWPSRKARGALAEQEAGVRQQLLQARKSQRQIQLEVGEIYDRLKSSAEQLNARQIAVDFARLVLRNERAKYDVQQATVHDLLLLERDLLEAELGLYQATAEHRKYQATLHQVCGILLDRWHIELADIPAPPWDAP
jgi:outer membrane protein TolC